MENAETKIYVVERDQRVIKEGIKGTTQQTDKIMNAIEQLNETLSSYKPGTDVAPSR
jgi:hypothetical protein